jgi:hypothetical protein
VRHYSQWVASEFLMRYVLALTHSQFGVALADKWGRTATFSEEVVFCFRVAKGRACPYRDPLRKAECIPVQPVWRSVHGSCRYVSVATGLRLWV